MTNLQTIQHLAEKINQEYPVQVVRHNLLCDVFREPINSEEITQAQVELEKSRWIQVLENDQWSDGSWGRLHSKDTKSKQVTPISATFN